MDFGNENEVTWNWQELHRSLSEESQYEISPWMDASYLINDANATPVKACVDAQWKVSETDDLIKEYEEDRVFSSQAKRRRILQFNDEPLEFPLSTEELPPAFLQPKSGEESMERLLPEISPWKEFVANSNFEMTEPYHWLTELLNDTDMNSEDMTLSAASDDVKFSVSDFCEIQENQKVLQIQKCPQLASVSAPKTPSGKVTFKGRTSYIKKTSTKLPSCVAYPFSFIKPCPVKGGMTLQDINRKILAPPPPPVHPNVVRSAISGKLVAGKTRIRTGGKGSITITRTRG